ncbi:DUF5011 domain-containing protein [bacterium]|nr:DUF5011 domain-containing protein [bacterium]
MTSGFTINQETMKYTARMYGDHASSSSNGADGAQCVMGIDLRQPGPNNAGVVSIDSPGVFCGGTHNIYATIGNFGSNQITEVTVNWEIDGSAQKPIVYKGTLDTINGKGSTEAQIYLGSTSFNTKHNILVYTTLPNNVQDTVTSNDSLDKDFGPSLSGNFTVGGAKSPFKTIKEVATALTNYGVCGPVTIKVRKGTYSGQVLLGDIVGTSATNTITFLSGGVDSVIITNSSDGTVSLQGADYVSFDGFYMKATGSSGAALHLANSSNYNTFKNCIMEADLGSTSSTLNPVVISSASTNASGYGDNGNYNLFQNNDIRGGYYGLICVGSSTAAMSEGNVFINNNFNRSYYYGVRFYYVSGFTFHDNVIKDFRNTYNYGLYMYYVSNFDVQRNKVIGAYYGNYFAYANYYNYRGTRSIFANNQLAGYNSSYGLYAYYMSYTNFYHNSVYSRGSYCMYWYYMNNMDIRNNIFYYEGTNYSIYTYNPTFVAWDYNDYVTKSGNLCYMGGTVYANLSALKSYSPNYNQHSFELDPDWLDKEKDHHIGVNFPSMYGPYVGVDLDFDQDRRCTLISTLGPDEFKQSSLPPTANFLLPDTAWLNSETVILNAAKPSITEGSRWYVNGKYVSDSIHLAYKPYNVGYDTIKLVRFNCGGTDSITKLVYVSPILRAPKVDFSATYRTIYAGDMTTLIDLSENGATQWSWGISPVWIWSDFLLIRDRTHIYDPSKDSTTANPRVRFNYPGKYEVTLKVANSFGADSITRKAFIIVREKGLMCSINNSSTASFGTVFDDGGPEGSYSPGLNGINHCTYYVSTCEGELDFTVDAFDLGANDYLKIYDGVDNTGTPLWNAAMYPDGMTGNRSDKSVSISFTAKSGSAYFDFESDNDANTIGKGFAISWDVNPVSWTNPMADFSAPDTACVGFPTYFENTSTGVYSDVTWDVNADNKIEGINETFGYTFNTVGTYTVKLKANSYCAGSDSMIKKIVIINANKAPKPEFSASATKISAGDTITLTDMTQFCSNFTHWTITPNTYVVANDGSLKNGQVDVLFTRGGFYTVTLTKGNTYGKDSLTKINYIQVLEYCTPSVANLNGDMGISRVVFNTIDNKSGVGKNGYNNFLNISTEVERGLTYAITLERLTNNNPMSRKVWIDWNKDGDFEDAGELVAYEATNTTMSFTDSITIPATATPGNTRMRVATNYKALQNLACGPHQFGEFEDYTVVVSNEDKTAPKLVLKGNLLDSVVVNTTWTDPGYHASDKLSGILTSKVQVNSTLDLTKVGTYVITYVVYDDAGNMATDKRTIVVYDNVKPTIVLNGADSVYVDVNTAYTELGATANDNYDVNPSVQVAGNVDTTTLGEYIVTYCVTDAGGNGPVCVERHVFVQDLEKPSIALVGADAVTVEQCGYYKDEGYTASDNGSYTVAKTGTFTGETNTKGTYTITYIATDMAGNMDSVTRTITVVDTKAPVLKMLGNQVDTVNRWSDYQDAGVEASDFCDDASDVTILKGGNFVNTQSEGIYTISYIGEDASGNRSSMLTRYVIVRELTSIGEINGADGITLYPNPSNGYVVLSSQLAKDKVANISVIDLSGRVVYTTNNVVLGGNTKLELNLDMLSAGTYQIQVSGTDLFSIKRLIISK